MNTIRTCLITLTTAITLTACGTSSDDTSATTIPDTTTTNETTTTSAPTTTTTSTTTTADSTTTVKTTTVETTSPPTTTPPTSTPTNPLLTEQAVHDAAQEIDNAFMDCSRRLPDCDGSNMNQWFTGPQLTQAEGLLSQASAAGYTLTNTEPRTLIVQTVTINPDTQTATTTECLYDETIVYDASETEVATDPGTAFYTRTYTIEDGRWKLRNQTTLEEIDGTNKCVG